MQKILKQCQISRKKNLERSGFRVYVRKVVSTVRELLQEEDVENIRPTLESHKINLEKQQKQIETLNQEIAELVGADAIEKEMLDRCEFEASLQETISLQFLHGYRLPRNPKIQPRQRRR